MIKFDFNKIKQKFLVYDAMSLPGIKLLLKKNNYNIYYNRYENKFLVLLKTIFSFNLIMRNYKINYIKSANPKIIIIRLIIIRHFII